MSLSRGRSQRGLGRDCNPVNDGILAHIFITQTYNVIIYWPVSFEAVDPEHSDTTFAFTVLAYRNAVGKWDAKVRNLRITASGFSQEVSEIMVKQLGL